VLVPGPGSLSVGIIMMLARGLEAPFTTVTVLAGRRQVPAGTSRTTETVNDSEDSEARAPGSLSGRSGLRWLGHGPPLPASSSLGRGALAQSGRRRLGSPTSKPPGRRPGAPNLKIRVLPFQVTRAGTV
jgi:hypothetical protein